jgi:hypothetical protein
MCAQSCLPPTEQPCMYIVQDCADLHEFRMLASFPESARQAHRACMLSAALQYQTRIARKAITELMNHARSISKHEAFNMHALLDTNLA